MKTTSLTWIVIFRTDFEQQVSLHHSGMHFECGIAQWNGTRSMHMQELSNLTDYTLMCIILLLLLHEFWDSFESLYYASKHKIIPSRKLPIKTLRGLEIQQTPIVESLHVQP